MVDRPKCYKCGSGMDAWGCVKCGNTKLPAERPVCTETHQAIDNGAPCIYLEGHLEANIPHTTKNGLWWFPN